MEKYRDGEETPYLCICSCAHCQAAITEITITVKHKQKMELV